MKRDIEKIKSEVFDVLVIGGGIHGSAIAREAVIKGFKTALIEMNDFGHSTSFNSMKVIHGGLRYLQHGNIKRIRQSIRSRKIFQQIASHLIKPVPFLIPTYGFGIKGRYVMKAALLLNDLLSIDRNNGSTGGMSIPGGKIINRTKALEILNGINDKDNLTGGAVWYEAVIQNTERMLMEILLDACNFDFTAANYVEAKDFIVNNNKIDSILVKDLLSSQKFPIKAEIIINAAGPWFNIIQNSLNVKPKPEIKLVKAINIIVRKKVFPYGVGLESKEKNSDKDAILKRGNRFYFFVPVEDYTMIGTDYKLYDGNPDNLKVTGEDIQEIIDEANYLCPFLKLTPEDVSFYHAGLLPMDESSVSDNINPARNSIIYKYDNLINLFSVKSVKYTTAPVIAEGVVKKAEKIIKPLRRVSKKYRQPYKNIISGLSENLAEHLHKKYKSSFFELLEVLIENKDNLKFISDSQILKGEVLHVIRNEMAVTLRDVILRRTGMGMLECPSYNAILETVSIMSLELGWDEEKVKVEINNLMEIYSPVIKQEENCRN